MTEKEKIISGIDDSVGILSGAIFSPCRKYRYLLWRRWDAGEIALWVLLNPSTADEVKNDPTVERCERRTRADGYGAIIVANLFGLRSTDPVGLRKTDDPVGPENDAWIGIAAARAGRVYVGWGNDGAYRKRGAAVRELISRMGVYTWCLGVTKTGEPRHPLYISYQVRPQPLVDAMADSVYQRTK